MNMNLTHFKMKFIKHFWWVGLVNINDYMFMCQN